MAFGKGGVDALKVVFEGGNATVLGIVSIGKCVATDVVLARLSTSDIATAVTSGAGTSVMDTSAPAHDFNPAKQRWFGSGQSDATVPCA